MKLLLRGYKCVTGCKTGRCSCRKSNRERAEGCQCTNGLNIFVSTTETNEQAQDEVIETVLEEEVRELEIETDELMDWVFANHDNTEDVEYGSDGDSEEVENT